uniref:Coiled-coil domain-containing protein 96 n=1 Tax=Geotrypetes seraphini TaxID=260995 RepID=A0A6P8RJ12_GEOSA|nr:coiled-coil domain-containing protein 96 [Geotrypetes seraphini]
MAAEESPADGELSSLQGQEEPLPAAKEEELHPDHDSQRLEEEPEDEKAEEQQSPPPPQSPWEKEPQPEGEETQAGETPAEEQRDARTPGGEEEKREEGAETVEEARVSEADAEPEPAVQEEQGLQQLSRQSSQAEEQTRAGVEGAADEEEEQQIEDTAERSELLLRYMWLSSERDRLIQQSVLVQHSISTTVRRRKDSDSRRSPKSRSAGQTPTQTSADGALEIGQRYQRTLEALTELRLQYARDAQLYKQQAEEMEFRCQEIAQRVDVDWRSFQERKKQVALAVLSRRGGKQAAVEAVEQMQAREQRREEAVVQVRLENIKLKVQVHGLETELRSSEELAQGLHLIDFEQLKIENQTYNEKIEERNEELLKLRRKITNTVHVLAHLKEKLQFVQAENQVKKERLAEVEAAVAFRRDILTKTKQARDSLRISNVKLRQKCGLLGNEALLRDFEGKIDAGEEMSRQLETLKRRHAELTLNCNAMKKKIKGAKDAKESKVTKASLQ